MNNHGTALANPKFNLDNLDIDIYLDKNKNYLLVKLHIAFLDFISELEKNRFRSNYLSGTSSWEYYAYLTFFSHHSKLLSWSQIAYWPFRRPNISCIVQVFGLGGLMSFIISTLWVVWVLYITKKKRRLFLSWVFLLFGSRRKRKHKYERDIHGRSILGVFSSYCSRAVGCTSSSILFVLRDRLVCIKVAKM